MWQQWFSGIRTAIGILHGNRAFGGPYQAILDLTNRCNIKCIHCYFHSPFLDRPNLKPVRQARIMGLVLPRGVNLDQIQRIDADTILTNNLIDEMLLMGTRRFQFSGSGEPFLHKNVLEFFARVKVAGSIATVNTNGLLLDRTTIDELIKMKFDELRITTMSGTRDMYERTHPGIREEAFDELQENLSYIAERKIALGVNKPRVNLNYVVTSYNYDGIMVFAEFANFIRADRVIFRPVDDLDDPDLAILVPTKTQATSVREQLIEVKNYLHACKIDQNIENFLKIFRKKLDTRELYRVIPCYYGWLSVLVEADGSVFPCCRCNEPLGNIHEKEFQKIWYGSTYRLFRGEAIRINRRKAPVRGCDCNSCVHHSANLKVYRVLHPVCAPF